MHFGTFLESSQYEYPFAFTFAMLPKISAVSVFLVRNISLQSIEGLMHQLFSQLQTACTDPCQYFINKIYEFECFIALCLDKKSTQFQLFLLLRDHSPELLLVCMLHNIQQL